MGNLVKEQNDTLALIDSILAMTEKLPDDKMSLNTSLNPIGYLLSIIYKMASFEDVVKWLSYTLVYTLPLVELGVKGVLLSNLKKLIDCNSDPRIPDYMRKKPNIFKLDDYNNGIGYHDDDTENERGILIPLETIDFENMLTISPLSALGYMYYFGTKSYYIVDGDKEGRKFHFYVDAAKFCGDNKISVNRIIDKSDVGNVYELARAKDYNAFLWFVIHKAQFRYPKEFIETETEDEWSDEFGGNSILDVITKDSNSTSLGEPFVPPYMPGDVIHQEGAYVMSLCFRSKKRKDVSLVNNQLGDIMVADPIPSAVNNMASITGCSNTFVPFSCDNFSANWYVDRSRYFDFLSPWNDKKREKKEETDGRDYSKEFAICNLQYVNKVTDGVDITSNLIRFTIMPKPYIYGPRLIRALFMSDGTPSKKGKYSVLLENLESGGIDDNGWDKVDDDTIKRKIKNGKYPEAYLVINKKTREYHIEVDGKNPTKAQAAMLLYECYPNITVYEFNYDYIMSMKLFDPVVIASKLIDMSMNSIAYMNYSFKVDKTETPYRMRMSEVIKKILEADAYSVSDCFYTFSNEEYDRMNRESEMKRAKQYPFNKNGVVESNTLKDKDKIEEILNGYDENATLQENEEVIKRAITQATASITDEMLPKDRYQFKDHLVKSMIQEFASLIMESILSPKILMLFEVNRKLIGDDGKPLNVEDLLRAMSSVIVGIALEIIDLIIKELLDWVLKILTDLALKLSTILIKEQLEYYTRLIDQLLKACAFKVNHRKPLDTKLDVVDYADIDAIEKPKDKNC